jgi:nucleoside-diphosphate-sugar epimerase
MAALASARAGQAFSLTAGEQVRDWIDVDDVVDGLLAAAEAGGVEGENFELGTGAGHSVAEVVARVYDLVGTPARPRLGMLPYRPGEVMRIVADPLPAHERLGWRARIGLDEGLRRLVEHGR